MSRVRLATLKDMPALVRFRRRMFEDIGVRDRRALDAQDRSYRTWARLLLRSRRFIGFIAEAEGRPVAGGAVWLRDQQPLPGRPACQPYLMSVYTEREHRGRGLASRITRAAIDWCREHGYDEHGYDEMRLHASAMGRRVYRRLGAKRTWEMRLDFRRRA